MNDSGTLHSRQIRAGSTTGRVGMKGAAVSTKADPASTAALARSAAWVPRVENAGAFKFPAAVAAAESTAAEVAVSGVNTL